MNPLAAVEFLYPSLIFLCVPAGIILLWLTRTSFIKDNPRFDDAKSVKRRNKLRWTVFLLRTLAIALLIIAIATPLIRQNIVKAGDTHITILIDNSSSMAVMDTAFIEGLTAQLREQAPVTVRTIALGEKSALGEAIIPYLQQNENVLLVSDGYSTDGATLAAVASFASQRNATINALALESRKYDASIIVQGPDKAITGTNSTFFITTTATNTDDHRIQVLVDGNEVFNDVTNKPLSVIQSFSPGPHAITAKLLDTDANAANNEYTWLITIVEKPKILLVTEKQTSLKALFDQLYSVTLTSTIPTNKQELDQYYAVILVDLPATAITPATQALTSYLLDGNGLLVAGGPHSYDYGGYKNTVFESLLPVTVGKGKLREGFTSIVIALDMSGSVEGGYEMIDGKLVFKKSDRPALVRSLGISILDDIDPNNNVGAVVVGSASKNGSENIREQQGQNELIQWDYIGGKDIGKVSPLGAKQTLLRDAMASVNGGGQAASQYWVAAPLKALESAGGSKNIIIITDGQSCTQNCMAANGGSDEEATINIAATIAAQGGKVYTIGVTKGLNEDFLADIAAAGNGIYFPADEKNKLRILFGDPSKNTGADAFGLVILNTNHFITRDVKLLATVYGYNEVIPKSYSSLLVTAGNGQPALTVWNYGVGRIASLTAYNGDDYGELVAKGNSLILSRTGNWIIGDPERKQESVISVPHMYVNEEATIIVHSSKIPVSDLFFVPKGKDTYTASFTPTQTGLGMVSGMSYAATYPTEYEQVGMNPDLEKTLAISKGKVFKPTDAKDILEHVQTVRQLQETTKKPLRYPFLIAAAILFLLELVIRRAYEIIRSRSY